MSTSWYQIWETDGLGARRMKIWAGRAARRPTGSNKEILGSVIGALIVNYLRSRAWRHSRVCVLQTLLLHSTSYNKNHSTRFTLISKPATQVRYCNCQVVHFWRNPYFYYVRELGLDSCYKLIFITILPPANIYPPIQDLINLEHKRVIKLDYRCIKVHSYRKYFQVIVQFFIIDKTQKTKSE